MTVAAELFRERVVHVHGLWAERRTMKELHTRHELAPQLLLIEQLHSWLGECVDDVRRVYGDGFPIELDVSAPESLDVSLELRIEGRPQVVCGLSQRAAGPASQWRVCVRARSRKGLLAPAGPDRRTGYWTRMAVEELVLEALANYERNLGGDVPSC